MSKLLPAMRPTIAKPAPTPHQRMNRHQRRAEVAKLQKVRAMIVRRIAMSEAVS